MKIRHLFFYARDVAMLMCSDVCNDNLMRFIFNSLEFFYNQRYKMPSVKSRDTPAFRRGQWKSRSVKKSMKKVTKKGAYKKNVKNQMIVRRAPLVETKQRTSSIIAALNGHGVSLMPEDQDPNGTQNYLTDGDAKQPLNWRIVPNDDAFYNIPLDVFNRNSRGLKDYQMIGDTIMAKWLNTRVEIKFPAGEIINASPNVGSATSRNVMIQDNYKVYLIWGWVTAPLHAPLADPSGDRQPVSSVTQLDLDQHIESQLKPYFDDNVDPLSFTPKQTTNIKIEKYIRVKPNTKEAIPTQAIPLHQGGNAAEPMIVPPTGSIPNAQRNHNFTINRKIRYDEGYPEEAQGRVDYENNFPNNSWLPFCVLYTPNFAVANAVPNYLGSTTPVDPISRHVYTPNERRCQHLFVRFNSQLNYTDS